MTDPCEGKFDIVLRLRDHINRDDNDIAEAAAYIERLRKERDEARRLYCEEAFAHRFNERGGLGPITDPKQIAQGMKWDCFKENTDD